MVLVLKTREEGVFGQRVACYKSTGVSDLPTSKAEPIRAPSPETLSESSAPRSTAVRCPQDYATVRKQWRLSTSGPETRDASVDRVDVGTATVNNSLRLESWLKALTSTGASARSYFWRPMPQADSPITLCVEIVTLEGKKAFKPKLDPLLPRERCA